MSQLEEGVSNGLDWDGGKDYGIFVYNRRHHCTLVVFKLLSSCSTLISLDPILQVSY